MDEAEICAYRRHQPQVSATHALYPLESEIEIIQPQHQRKDHDSSEKGIDNAHAASGDQGKGKTADQQRNGKDIEDQMMIHVDEKDRDQKTG